MGVSGQSRPAAEPGHEGLQKCHVTGRVRSVEHDLDPLVAAIRHPQDLVGDVPYAAFVCVVPSHCQDRDTSRTPTGPGTLDITVAPNASRPPLERVTERRRAVALARHYREAEDLSIAQIAARLGRSPATIKAYFYDPTGEKARAVKARYRGVCRGCGAYTQPRNGKGDAYAYCNACRPGAIGRRWTREQVVEAMRDWGSRYERLPSSYDWSRTHARRRGGKALERLAAGEWPAASVVTRLFGAWAVARAAASRSDW